MLEAIEEPAAFPSSATFSGATSTAQITPIAPKDRGRVLNSFNIWTAAGLTLLPIPAGLIGGLGGLGLAAYLYAKMPLAAALCGAGGLAIGIASVFGLVSFQHFLASRYLRWVARRALEGRPDLLVRTDGAECDFVDFLPRSHWGQNMLEPATDIGFFAIDSARRELLFEGDSKRYRIPFGAVTSCQVEDYVMGREQWDADRHFVTVINVETANGPREIPLAGRHLAFRARRAPERRAQALDFCSRILMALNG